MKTRRRKEIKESKMGQLTAFLLFAFIIWFMVVIHLIAERLKTIKEILNKQYLKDKATLL